MLTWYLVDPQHCLKYLPPYLQHDEDVVHHDLVFGVYKIHGLGDPELFSQLYECWLFDDQEIAFDKCVGLGQLLLLPQINTNHEITDNGKTTTEHL
jgi:hypothetical protein